MGETKRERIAARLELIASVAWLGMDVAWMEQLSLGALFLAAPTTLCSLLAVAFTRREVAARCVVGAMAAWAFMNSFWMLEDFSLVETLWPARACFLVSLLLLAVALAASGSIAAVMQEILSSFRRLRSK